MTQSVQAQPAIRPKEFHFPIAIDWMGERRVAARVGGKPTVEITAPPVFRGTDPSAWSPEDLYVAAAASCLAVTFTGLAAREHLEYAALHVDADGVAGRRDDGRFGFTRLSLRLRVETDPADEVRAGRLAEQAEETCLVSASLDVPIDTEIEVSVRACSHLRSSPEGPTPAGYTAAKSIQST